MDQGAPLASIGNTPTSTEVGRGSLGKPADRMDMSLSCWTLVMFLGRVATTVAVIVGAYIVFHHIEIRQDPSIT